MYVGRYKRKLLGLSVSDCWRLLDGGVVVIAYIVLRHR